MDMEPIKTGQDKEKKGRVAWEVYDSRGNKMLIIGIYGPPGPEEAADIKFFEEEVFSIIDKTTYGKVKIVVDWNVFLDPHGSTAVYIMLIQYYQQN